MTQYYLMPYPLSLRENGGFCQGIPQLPVSNEDAASDATSLIYDFKGSIPIKRKGNPILAADAYRLHIEETNVVIESSCAQGYFYAVTTLRQLCLQFKDRIPCLTIEDSPATPHRGVQISYGQVHVEYKKEWLF